MEAVAITRLLMSLKHAHSKLRTYSLIAVHRTPDLRQGHVDALLTYDRRLIESAAGVGVTAPAPGA